MILKRGCEPDSNAEPLVSQLGLLVWDIFNIKRVSVITQLVDFVPSIKFVNE